MFKYQTSNSPDGKKEKQREHCKFSDKGQIIIKKNIISKISKFSGCECDAIVLRIYTWRNYTTIISFVKNIFKFFIKTNEQSQEISL